MPVLTTEQVLEIAKAALAERNWPWLQPVEVHERLAWFIFGKREWHVLTNAEARGGNPRLVIDDSSGHVTNSQMVPR
jgi:hypothetical protein